MARKVGHYERWIGTEAERLALTTTGFSPGASFFERDTGLMYRWDGTAWGAASTGGNGDTSSDIEKWGGTTLTGRDISGDLKSLTTVTDTGLLKSIGDIGATGSLIARVGDTDDALVAAGEVGSLSAKLRRLSQDIHAVLGWVTGTDTTSAPQTTLAGQTVAEVLTQADATGDPAVTLTFADDIQAMEIYHDEEALQTFVVNGITLHIASGGWRSPMGGTAAAVVTIPEAVNCVVTRLV